LANLRGILNQALITLGILTAAAIAVAAIPLIGGFISASLWAAVATAFALVLVLDGMVIVAIKQSSDQKAAVTAARNREVTAMAAMMMNCSPEQQQTCLAGLMPCS
jgi:NADH:ubiquinone oxidoreductase subunit 4 (subunit M)